MTQVLGKQHAAIEQSWERQRAAVLSGRARDCRVGVQVTLASLGDHLRPSRQQTSPAKLETRVRMLPVGHGRKNDDADAVSVGIAALTAPGLRSAAVEEAIIALRALVEHRDDVVRTRTQTVNRLPVLLTALLPGGAPRKLTADTAARLPPHRAPRATAPATLHRLAADLITEMTLRRFPGRTPPIAPSPIWSVG